MMQVVVPIPTAQVLYPLQAKMVITQEFEGAKNLSLHSSNIADKINECLYR